MNEGLHLPPAEVDPTSLLPLLAPAAFLSSGNRCGPSVRLRNPDVGLTWVVRMPGQTMRCLNFQIQERWEAEGLDRELYAISFMFQDGLSPRACCSAVR